jgi:glutathione S-transferase
MKVTLFVIPGSHPGIAARLMLERKGVDYRRIDLPPAFSRRLIKLFGFSGDRTPAMKIDGRKVQGSPSISRELDRVRPDPPLFPADPDKRRRVEEAERWGSEEFQQIPRTIIWWAFKRDRSGMRSFLRDSKLGPPGLAVRTAGPIIRRGSKLNQSDDDHVQAELDKLPGALDKVDRWIGEGLLNGDELNAADYQLAPTIRLLMAFEDLEPVLEGRPAAELARRVLPDPAGRVPRVYPPEWIERLQRSPA